MNSSPANSAGKKLGVVFYVATVEQHAVNVKEAQRCAGFDGFMGGNLMVARALHDPDLTETMNSVKRVVCADCAIDTPIVSLAFPNEPAAEGLGEMPEVRG